MVAAAISWKTSSSCFSLSVLRVEERQPHEEARHLDGTARRGRVPDQEQVEAREQGGACDDARQVGSQGGQQQGQEEHQRQVARLRAAMAQPHVDQEGVVDHRHELQAPLPEAGLGQEGQDGIAEGEGDDQDRFEGLRADFQAGGSQEERGCEDQHPAQCQAKRLDPGPLGGAQRGSQVHRSLHASARVDSSIQYRSIRRGRKGTRPQTLSSP
ncbi:MAG: hypothetical protein DMF50_12050 [Acidobacteria bacterium]|nr:MAG: hypothetical protein DMF50_12050 [Acidobacteriota bacterium]